ncbi:MAG: hypothetical protein FWD29_02470 [Micrococcales bacterium]|nr:hypothetical protein [Micrococcales bacterium]
MSERNLDGPESFEQRWRELAEELARDLPTDLTQSAQERTIHHAMPVELGPEVLSDDEAGFPPEPTLAGPRDWEAPEVEEHFEPPEAPPVLGGDPGLTLGWIALVGGVLTAVVWTIVRPALDPIVAWMGLAAAVGGGAFLIWRMPHRRDPEDDDTGAQV